MSEKEPQQTGKFAIFVPFETGIENGVEYLEMLGLASDGETAEEAAIKVTSDMGVESWSMEKINPDGTRGKRKFFFSGATWRDPRQSEGLNPNLPEVKSTEPKN